MSEIWKKRILILSVILIICAISVINFKLQNETILETSSDFVDFEEKQLEQIKGDLIIGGRESFDEAASDEIEESDTSEVSVKVSDSNYFVEAQSIINMDRNKILSMLTDIIEDREVGAESKSMAVEQKLKIIEYMNQEQIIVNLLDNKGFESVLILITDNSVNVTVGASSLNKSDIAKILDVVMRETSRPIEQIVIQNKI